MLLESFAALLVLAAAASSPDIHRAWIEPDVNEPSDCVVQFSLFTLYVEGLYLESVDAVALVGYEDSCANVSVGSTKFLSRSSQCAPEVPGPYPISTGATKLLCSVTAREPGSSMPCFSMDSGLTFPLGLGANQTSLTIIQYDTFAMTDGLVPPGRKFPGKAHVNAISTRSNGIVIVGYSDGYVRLWDGASATELWSSPANTLDKVPVTAVDSRGDLMAISGANGRASVWNITGTTASEYSVLRVDNEPSSFNCIALSPNTTDIIAVGSDLGRVFIFRVSVTLSPVVGMAQVGEPVSVVKWCHNGMFVVVGTLAGSVSWWSLIDLTEPSAVMDGLCGGRGGVADLQCATFASDDVSYVFVACTSGTITVLRFDDTLKPVVSNTWSLPNKTERDSLIVAMSLSSDLEWLAVRAVDFVFVYDTNETLSSEHHPEFWDVLNGSRLLTEGSSSWYVVEAGSAGNAPFAGINPVDGSVSFYPCWPSPDADRRSTIENISELTCASSSAAPTIALDVVLPWEFTAIRGSYTVSSIGAIPAEDCRSGQLPVTDWISAPGWKWTLVRTFSMAVSSDCSPLDGGGSPGSQLITLKQCLDICVSLGHSSRVCNVVNALPKLGTVGFDRLVTVCDLRHCDDVTALRLQATTNNSTDGKAFEVWGRYNGSAFGGGYTAFGTPDRVVYGGCSVPGGKVPHGSAGGALMVLNETIFRSHPSNRLRFQVAQSNAEERVMIHSIRLELLRQRPQPVRVIRDPLVSSSGDSEVDANSRRGGEVSGASSKGAIAWGRANDATASPWLFFSSRDLSVAAFDLRGLYLQEVPDATGTQYMWWKWKPTVVEDVRRNIAPQRPSSIFVAGVGLDLTSTIRINQVPYCGAMDSRYHHSAVNVPNDIPIVTIQGTLNITVLEWTNDALWSNGLAGLLVVSGPDYDRNYHVCRWGYACVISNYVGHGLQQDDRLRLSPFTGVDSGLRLILL
ncbi:hypothetical protein Pmar_PMAR023605 [Perkinsus marinus ATCC 50983]|uniref:Uncharacterized protein n=1 Tax=Perkinsus marinus (strain ATCC 50983 / TXsc) TaxID=423536 RepID=C5KCT5_PERM5|nr:hypothetical protein Pmar_PMAR023605 [Perkinsus marinus ATCC 50983]EER17684.1 hypothetical protein Pmar_PMAR023605 [Perkinsus marinus ATCC 50983]|eukprot:XP_002785888.1 hypothetical protein Pmar_PMAR023605 [Perkinsus marinus ATCC 50983]